MKKIFLILIFALAIVGCKKSMPKGDVPLYTKNDYFEQDAGGFYFGFRGKNKCIFNEIEEYEESFHSCVYNKKENTITHYDDDGEIMQVDKIIYWDEEDMIYEKIDYAYNTQKLTYRSSKMKFNYNKFADEVEVDLAPIYINNKDEDYTISDMREIKFDTKNKTFEYKEFGDFSQEVKGTYKAYKDKYGFYPITIILENDKNLDLKYYYDKSDKNLYIDEDLRTPDYIIKETAN